MQPQGPEKDADQQSRYIYAATEVDDDRDKWDIVYVDDMPKDLKKGDVSDFGFKIETDFYIVSAMGRGRYVDLVSNDVKLKVSNGRTSQKWFFDNKTKTIKSRRTPSYSL